MQKNGAIRQSQYSRIRWGWIPFRTSASFTIRQVSVLARSFDFLFRFRNAEVAQPGYRDSISPRAFRHLPLISTAIHEQSRPMMKRGNGISAGIILKWSRFIDESSNLKMTNDKSTRILIHTRLFRLDFLKIKKMANFISRSRCRINDGSRREKKYKTIGKDVLLMKMPWKLLQNRAIFFIMRTPKISRIKRLFRLFTACAERVLQYNRV